MKLPDGYEANIVPRSSTYKNFKVLQTNSFAVIDNSYSGDNDQWLYPVIAMEDTVINKMIESVSSALIRFSQKLNLKKLST